MLAWRTITLNRPKIFNAMNKQMWVELSAAIENAKTDDEVRVLIFTGEGRAFSDEMIRSPFFGAGV